MYLLDSSVWIALFRIDDSHHARALEVMVRVGETPIRLPYGVILETLTNLTYKSSKEHANRFVEFVRGNPQIIHDAPSATHDMAVFFAESTRISFVDALLKDVALRENVELVTFDEELLKLVTRAHSSSSS